MTLLAARLLLVLGSAHAAMPLAAAGSIETIWSSVIVTRNGDSVPLIANEPTVVTPLGAQQMFAAGTLFRDRYITGTAPGNLTIPNISMYQIDNTQTFALSLLDEYVAESAQAFIQGLYPPLNNSFSTDDPIITPESLLANSTNVAFPLGGYQYPLIYATSQLDPNSVWLSGEVNCNGFVYSGSEYFGTPEYQNTLTKTQAFYDSVGESIFGGELNISGISYHNAYYLFDYISYGYTHNVTINKVISEEDLFQFRTLADQWAFAINGNTSASGFTPGDRVRTIGGQTLAAEILGLLFNNVENGGTQSKLNLLFTTFDPMVSLFSLLGLPDLYSQFYGLPSLGSSIVFELFTSSNATFTTYPSPADLQVRFLFRNGTNSTDNLDTYAIFGNSETEQAMSLNDFTSAMEGIMLSTVGEWCDICQAETVFCPAYTNATASTPSIPSENSNTGMHPAVAGVIGAIVALVLAGLVLAFVMLVFGVRFHRSKAKRRSNLGGFKGSEKLASDADVNIIKGGAGATVVTGHAPGHERVGSWELGEAGKRKDMGLEHGGQGRPSFEADGDSIRGVPVKVDEAV